MELNVIYNVRSCKSFKWHRRHATILEEFYILKQNQHMWKWAHNKKAYRQAAVNLTLEYLWCWLYTCWPLTSLGLCFVCRMTVIKMNSREVAHHAAHLHSTFVTTLTWAFRAAQNSYSIALAPVLCHYPGDLAPCSSNSSFLTCNLIW